MIISVFDRVENIVGKVEIAHYEQFLLSYSVFERLVSQGHQKVSLCRNGLKALEKESHDDPLSLPYK